MHYSKNPLLSVKIHRILSGGIGDCLIGLSRFPIKILSSLGLRICIYYNSPNNPAAPKILPILKDLEWCSLATEAPSPSDVRLAKTLSRHFFSKQPFLFPPQIRNLEIPKPNSKCKKIIIQTHMDGHHGANHLTAKIGSAKMWAKYIHLLKNHGNYQVDILEWNLDSASNLMAACSEVKNLASDTLLDNFRRILEADLVVSVDSWSKYVARWGNKKQVIIVPDLRQNYVPYFKTLTPDEVAKGWFFGLTNRNNINIIGLEKRNQRFEYTLPSVSILDAEYLFQRTIGLLN